MANPTALSVCNRILEHAGEQPVSSVDFNAETNLTKLQLQAKRFVDKVNRRLGRKSRLRTQKRKQTLNLTSASNTYSLPTGVYLEDLVEETMVITAGVTGGYAVIRYLPYEDWIRMFPAGETNKGFPQYFFDYPSDGTNIEKIGFSSPPGSNYTVQYEYILVPGSISQATDEIFLSSRYEDILWDYGQMWLEVSKSEGKAQDYANLIDELTEELRQYNYGSLEKPVGIDLGFKLCGTLRKGGGYGLRVRSPN